MPNRPHQSNPRRAAFTILCEARRTGRFVDDLLDKHLPRLGLPDTDRRLAIALVEGVTKRALSLDAVIAAFSKSPLAKIEPDVLVALRLGVYQLVYLQRVPDHAAVNETVNLVRKAARPHVVRFANGLLRAVSRSVERVPSENASALFDPRRLPAGPGRAAVFDRDIVPSRTPAEALSIERSYPLELVERFVDAFGLAETRRLLALGNRPPEVQLRPNARTTSTEAVLRNLKDRGVEAEAMDSGLVRTNNLSADIVRFALDAGKVSVQDSAAFEAVRLALRDVDPSAPVRVLDTCAAPGGKATAVAERLTDAALVAACDSNVSRLRRVVENVKHLGLPNVAVAACDGAQIDRVFTTRFDRVLCDAPCSNTGVLRRRAEARYRVTAASLEELVALQRRLIAGAWRAVAPGGRLCYSTCSLLPEENEAIVEELVASDPSAELLDQTRRLPDEEGSEGGYAALVARRRL